MRGLLDVHPDMDPIEKEIILVIIGDALKLGYSVTVHDGVEIAIERSNNKEEIFSAMFATGSDVLFFHQCNRQVGWVLLIYGNCECIVSDYADNSAMDDLLKNADVLAEKYTPDF